MADINLQVGNGSKFGSLNLVSNFNNQFISATFSNISISNTNTTAAIFEPNPSNPNVSIKGTPVVAGSGSITVTVTAIYTDAGDGQVHTESMSVTKTFEVLAAPHGAKLQINFNS